MKGHSERVPNKNMRNFAGAPLYHVVARTLSASDLVSEILINTDSEVIKADALKHFPKVRIIDRPLKLCGDMTPMNDIIAFDMSQSEDLHFIQTHSTNPLLTVDSLNKAIRKYFESLSKYDSLFTVSRIQKRLYDDKGAPLNHDPAVMMRTQDIKPIYEENSCIFIFSKDSFENAGRNRVGLKPQLFELNGIEATDIDEPIDFLIAETLYKAQIIK